MQPLIFATTNIAKQNNARSVFDPLHITFTAKSLEITEIQSNDSAAVALDKAQKAYDILQQPVLVSDDAWSITALGGFPGVYMHPMNDWFSVEDWLHLTRPLTNKQVFLLQHLVYIDNHQQKTFTSKTEGVLLEEPRGTDPMASHMIMSMIDDNGLSIAEVYASDVPRGNRRAADVYKAFAEWYLTQGK